MNSKKYPLIVTILLSFYFNLVKCESNNNNNNNKEEKVVFQFPEFDYKESSKNELTYREFESACDQSSRCLIMNLVGIDRVKCVRECVSPSCYQEIYKFDELEEGEIDVRLNSFKGCFIQRLNRPRN